MEHHVGASGSSNRPNSISQSRPAAANTRRRLIAYSVASISNISSPVATVRADIVGTVASEPDRLALRSIRTSARAAPDVRTGGWLGTSTVLRRRSTSGGTGRSTESPQFSRSPRDEGITSIVRVVTPGTTPGITPGTTPAAEKHTTSVRPANKTTALGQPLARLPAPVRTPTRGALFPDKPDGLSAASDVCRRRAIDPLFETWTGSTSACRTPPAYSATARPADLKPSTNRNSAERRLRATTTRKKSGTAMHRRCRTPPQSSASAVRPSRESLTRPTDTRWTKTRSR